MILLISQFFEQFKLSGYMNYELIILLVLAILSLIFLIFNKKYHELKFNNLNNKSLNKYVNISKHPIYLSILILFSIIDLVLLYSYFFIDKDYHFYILEFNIIYLLIIPLISLFIYNFNKQYIFIISTSFLNFVILYIEYIKVAEDFTFTILMLITKILMIWLLITIVIHSRISRSIKKV